MHVPRKILVSLVTPCTTMSTTVVTGRLLDRLILISNTKINKLINSTATRVTIASYPGLLAPAFVACVSTASDKRWAEKAWVRG